MNTTLFSGKLDNTTVKLLSFELSKCKSRKLEDRMAAVNKILNNTQFFNLYFDKHFKASIYSYDNLSEGNMVCKLLERFSTFILSSDEIKQMEDDEKTKYTFYRNSGSFDKAIRKDIKMSDLCSEEHLENTMHFLEPMKGNKKKSKNQVILKSDLEKDNFLGQVLRDYAVMSDLMKRYTKEKTGNRYLSTKIIGEVANDMIYSKDCLTGAFGFNLKNALKESTVPNLDMIDLTNIKHLIGFPCDRQDPNAPLVKTKGLIDFVYNGDMQDDFQVILYDLKNLIDISPLTEEEKQVVDLIQEGYTNKDICDIMKVLPARITRLKRYIGYKVSIIAKQEENKCLQIL